ncbi:MAG TPA: DUF4375 domain-containing protein [Puia sp.]|nr:DUF4375 domain-containing protein [Puia sp.]
MIVKAKVNAETIKDLTDEQLDSLVYEKASQLDCGTFGEHFTHSAGHVLLCEIFATAVLDGEVHNGGFDQFFYQNARLLPFAMEGLKKIGAHAHAGLLARAMPVYEAHQQNFTSEDDDYERSPELDELDSEYYALPDSYSMRIRFVRDNIEKFFD